MIEAGDVYLADVGRERRIEVVVVSGRRFNRAAHRIIVAPAIDQVAGEPLMPWRLATVHGLFAVDWVVSASPDRLLTRRATLDAADTQALKRIVRLVL